MNTTERIVEAVKKAAHTRNYITGISIDSEALYNAIDSVIGRESWISVSDQMPEDGEKVLCYSEKYKDTFSAICNNKNNDGRFQRGTAFYWAGTEISHWQPLPAPPLSDLTPKTNNNPLNEK
jgi:hypothetical protein